MDFSLRMLKRLKAANHLECGGNRVKRYHVPHYTAGRILQKVCVMGVRDKGTIREKGPAKGLPEHCQASDVGLSLKEQHS